MKAKSSKQANTKIQRSVAAFEANITRHEVAAMNAQTQEEREQMMQRVEQTRARLAKFKRAS